MHCYTQCPQPCSRPLPSHASVRDLWTLMGKSGSVYFGVTAPFSWVLVHTRFCLTPPIVDFLVLCKFWQLYGEVNGNLLQEGLCDTQVCCTQSPCPCSRPLVIHTSSVQFSSVAQSYLIFATPKPQHARPPCPSPTPGVHSDSHPSSQ